MKGLLVKDLKFIMLQKNFFALILMVVIGMMTFTDDIIFPVAFLCFIVSLFTVTTISYDDFDNSNMFLFTLPITRHHYVIEKYYLGLLLGGISWVFATVLGMMATLFKGTLAITDFIMIALLILPIMIIIQVIMIPFQLQFGGDKGRIAMIGVFGALALISLIVEKGVKDIFHIDLFQVFNALSTVSVGVFVVGVIVIALIILFVSLKVSLSIINKKEF
jgi:hypothetical protein